METQEKEITYQTTNSYATLNTQTNYTKNVWFVCHGMGYLSRYFLRYFKELNPAENYIIAPQAPSKYYVPPKQKHVGSCWLTKENTVNDTQNIMRYFDAIYETEQLSRQQRIIMLGYSQGVSVALRYLAYRKIQCSHVVLMSGGIPKELDVADFKFMNPDTKVFLIYGTKDAFLDEPRILEEKKRFMDLFDHCDLRIVPFDGTHEVNIDLICQITTS